MKKLYRNARLQDTAECQDILVEDDKFAAIAPHLEAADAVVIDLGGKLTVPPYVDPHIHLDYVYTARQEGATNQTGTLFEGIQRWSETKADATTEEIKQRARKAVREEVTAGVQYIRTHADVTDPSQTSLTALLELREELKDIVTIQIVAFPQNPVQMLRNGILVRPSSDAKDNIRLIAAAGLLRCDHRNLFPSVPLFFHQFIDVLNNNLLLQHKLYHP